MKRTYIDVHGQTRTITFIEKVEGLVPWLTPQPDMPDSYRYSTASRWLLDGQQIQIPDDVWGTLITEYKDE